MFLIDSDVLIWLTRGQQRAKARLSKINPWRISAITYMELAQGCRNKDELQRAKRGLERKDMEIFPLTPSISERAMHLLRITQLRYSGVARMKRSEIRDRCRRERIGIVVQTLPDSGAMRLHPGYACFLGPL